jgi:serine/threonine-protein kinase
VVKDTLRTLGKIAQGGMARVDLAVVRDGTFTRLFAVKRLHAHYCEDSAVRAMFLNEARVAGLLHHPNIVSVLDVGEDDAGPYLVMDYVDGVPLSVIVSHLAREGDRIPLKLALDIGAQIADGLHAAHNLSTPEGPLDVVHRDVSPQNVLVDYEGVVRVTDFGIAKAGASSTTVTDALKGKVCYMAPEQLRFEPATHRSDLFSLGVVLYELLTAKRLYGSSLGDVRAAFGILNEPPPDLGEARGDAPAELVGLLFELLAKDPSQRPTDARAVARRLRALVAECDDEVDLRDFMAETFGSRRDAERARVQGLIAGLASSPPPAPIIDAPEPESRTPRRRRAALALAAGVALFAGSALYLALADDGGEAHVTVEVASAPAGAEVWVDGQSRGLTPVRFELPKGDQPLELRLAKPGFEDARRSLLPQADQHLELVLQQVAPAPVAPSAKPSASTPGSSTPATAPRNWRPRPAPSTDRFPRWK